MDLQIFQGGRVLLFFGLCFLRFKGGGVLLLFQRGGLQKNSLEKGTGVSFFDPPLVVKTRFYPASRNNSIFRRAQDWIFKNLKAHLIIIL
jgi:hypothetical protein